MSVSGVGFAAPRTVVIHPPSPALNALDLPCGFVHRNSLKDPKPKT